MICYFCRTGGQAIADGHPSQAELEHSFCDNAVSGTHSWCDCQHKTTRALVRGPIATETTTTCFCGRPREGHEPMDFLEETWRTADALFTEAR